MNIKEHRQTFHVATTTKLEKYIPVMPDQRNSLERTESLESQV